jgi:hypothetical protein
MPPRGEPFYPSSAPERAHPQNAERKSSEPKPIQAARTILTIGRHELDGPPKSVARRLEGLNLDIRMAHVPPRGIFKDATPEQVEWLRALAARVSELRHQVQDASTDLDVAGHHIAGLTKEDLDRMEAEVGYAPDED